MFGYDWPRLHAALNDLPAALLIAAVLFDLLAAATRREGLRIASFWTLMLGTLGAVAAVISGLQAESHIAHGEAVHELMKTHEKLALVTQKAEILFYTPGVPGEYHKTLWGAVFSSAADAVHALTNGLGQDATIALMPEGPYVLAKAIGA